MTREGSRQRAERLLELHRGGALLVLPNVWSPIGARVLEAKGALAVATASAAVSASLGFVDGERISRATMVDCVGRIARSVAVPVTADIEAGYGETTAELGETIGQVLDAGVVGVNLEDGLEARTSLRPIHEQRERIATAREVARAAGIPLVINARIDAFLSISRSGYESAMEDVIARAAAYVEAGADCVYPIGPNDERTVGALRAAIDAPLNVLAVRGTSLAMLNRLRVNRVSFGPFVFRACVARFVELAGALLERDDTSVLDGLTADELLPYLRDGRE